MTTLLERPTAACTASPSSETDDLVRQVREGSDGALRTLLADYRPLARLRARSYFLAGAERDDVVQEAMIGLLKAVRDYDPAREASFHTFADLCMTRQILTAVKAATRQKHGPLNDAVPLPSGGESAESGDRGQALLEARGSDPVELLISRERVRALQTHVDAVLSDFEADVLRLHVEGRSQADIGERLGRSTKAVDNALQRVKRKLWQHLDERTLREAG